MLLSSLQPPLLERSLQLSSFIATKTMTTQRVASGCIAATRSAVAPRRYTPGIGKIVPRNLNK